MSHILTYPPAITTDPEMTIHHSSSSLAPALLMLNASEPSPISLHGHGVVQQSSISVHSQHHQSITPLPEVHSPSINCIGAPTPSTQSGQDHHSSASSYYVQSVSGRYIASQTSGSQSQCKSPV